MKNVCVVTVYNSINSGSYWQAKSLELFLNSKGCQVFFLKRNDITSSSHFFSKIKTVGKRFLLFQFDDAIRFIKTYISFSNLQKNFKIIKNTSRDMKKIDLIFLGSDTIWNLQDKHFAKNYRRYFGGIFENKNVVSYAASSANTSIGEIQKYNDIDKMLDNLQFISVRDTLTYNLIKTITTNNISIVCDPTLLLSRRDYLKMTSKRIEVNKYIFLYLFSDLSYDEIVQIKKIADDNNFMIVSGARYMNFANKCIINSPELFLNYMLYAEFVITDTFHGTIFSINLNKQFIVINRNKNKVNELIKEFNLTDRLIDENNLSICELFKKQISFIIINGLIAKKRKISIRYLDNILDKIN